MKKGDYFILILGLSVTIFSGFFVLTSSAIGSTIKIQTAQGIFLYPSGQDRKVKVSGPLGNTLVLIEEDGFSIQSSPCRNQLCVSMGKSHQWVACLPNRILVHTQGKAPVLQKIDTYAY